MIKMIKSDKGPVSTASRDTAGAVYPGWRKVGKKSRKKSRAKRVVKLSEKCERETRLHALARLCLWNGKDEIPLRHPRLGMSLQLPNTPVGQTKRTAQ